MNAGEREIVLKEEGEKRNKSMSLRALSSDFQEINYREGFIEIIIHASLDEPEQYEGDQSVRFAACLRLL